MTPLLSPRHSMKHGAWSSCPWSPYLESKPLRFAKSDGVFPAQRMSFESPRRLHVLELLGARSSPAWPGALRQLSALACHPVPGAMICRRHPRTLRRLAPSLVTKRSASTARAPRATSVSLAVLKLLRLGSSWRAWRHAKVRAWGIFTGMARVMHGMQSHTLTIPYSPR